MTDVQTYQQQHRQLLAEAVRALTDAARLSYPVGEGDQQREEHADFAEFVTRAVQHRAASSSCAPADPARGRPTTWGMLVSTVVAAQADLLEHRTEPITVVVNVDDLLTELGVWQLYEEADEELQDRDQAIASFPRMASAARGDHR